MATGTPTNRTNLPLPNSVSTEILQKTQEASSIMQLAKRIPLPGNGVQIPIITSDPVANWVTETSPKPVSNPGLNKKVMQAHKLAVIVPFSMEFKRDMASLYGALVQRLPNALGKEFDKTVFFGTDSTLANFDDFSEVTTQSFSGTDGVYGGLVAADTDMRVAGNYADDAEQSSIISGSYMRIAGNYADDAEHWAEVAEQYAQGALRYIGSVLFEDIPTTGMKAGDMYNMEDDFVTDERFQEGAGKSVGAGSNIAYNKDGKWDVLAIGGGGGAVSGVKGNAETDYRQGNVNLTPADIGYFNGSIAPMGGCIPASDGDGEKYFAGDGVWKVVKTDYETSGISKLIGDTSVTFTDENILTTSSLDLLSENDDNTPIFYTGVTVSAGTATYTFNALTIATTFYLRICGKLTRAKLKE